MIVKEESLVVDSSKRDAEGKELAPEERLATKTTEIEADISLGGGQSRTLKSAKVIQEMPAHVMADEVSKICRSCAHWDNPRWAKEYERTKNDPNLKSTFDQLRGQVIGKDPSSFDPKKVERVMRGLGFCHALAEVFGHPFATHPEETCPSRSGPQGEDCSKLYKAASRRDALQVGAVHDGVLWAAEGRGTKVP